MSYTYPIVSQGYSMKVVSTQKFYDTTKADSVPNQLPTQPDRFEHCIHPVIFPRHIILNFRYLSVRYTFRIVLSQYATARTEMVTYTHRILYILFDYMDLFGYLCDRQSILCNIDAR